MLDTVVLAVLPLRMGQASARTPGPGVDWLVEAEVEGGVVDEVREGVVVGLEEIDADEDFEIMLPEVEVIVEYAVLVDEDWSAVVADAKVLMEMKTCVVRTTSPLASVKLLVAEETSVEVI